MADITFMLAVTLPFYLLAERSIYDQKKIISIRNSNFVWLYQQMQSHLLLILHLPVPQQWKTVVHIFFEWRPIDCGMELFCYFGRRQYIK